jgi:hypothetical protein
MRPVQLALFRFRFWESKLLCCSPDRLFQDRRAAAGGSITVQRLAIDKGTFEWYKRRIGGGIKSLILLGLLSSGRQSFPGHHFAHRPALAGRAQRATPEVFFRE